MKARLKVFGLLGLIWVLYFELARILFLLYQFKLSSGLSLYEILMPIGLGLRMDLAMAGYWLLIPGLALTASFFIPGFISKWAIGISFYLFAIFSTLVIVGDFELYRHWGFRIDTTPLLYVGSEGIGSVPGLTIFFLLVIFAALMIALHLAFTKIILPRLSFPHTDKKYSLLMFFFVALLIVPIRSSFQVAPLNTGVVYFHKTKPFPNHVGINAVWNFLKSVVSDDSFSYPSSFMEKNAALKVFTEMMKTSDSTARVFNQQQPNIILIILEGFTSKIIEPLGGMPGITPNLNRLCGDGILFNEFYASGDRTDKGLIAILSGYPAQPTTSIIKYPKKTQSLPALPKVLSMAGYHASFVYGGDIGFANMESYLNISGFSHITQDDDFDLLQNNSKWGVHDEFVFNRLLQECDTASQNINPFFKTMLSLSSHEPFDVPYGNPKSKDEETLFLNSCSYTDSCLGQFINQAKQQPWWKNSVIIITADHGHRHPGGNTNYAKEKFQIPMLWLGGAIDSARLVSRTGSQTDLVTTLLSQLKIKNSEFAFSKDLLSKEATPFAVYSFNNGFGYISPTAELVYDFDLHNFLVKSGDTDESGLLQGKAYMQMLFNDYNKR